MITHKLAEIAHLGSLWVSPTSSLMDKATALINTQRIQCFHVSNNLGNHHIIIYSLSHNWVFDGKLWTETVNVAGIGNQLRKVHMDYTMSAVGCRAEGLSAIWRVDGEPIWVLSLQRRPTILLYPFWSSSYKRLKNVWIIFICTVIHLWLHTMHVSWKYAVFSYKKIHLCYQDSLM